MENGIGRIGYETFVARLDELKGHARNGAEMWTGRDLQSVLGYSAWRNFETVIEKARTACDSGGVDASKHFVEVDNMVTVGSGGQRQQEDWIFSRYACYLVAMNGDATKAEIGHAQAYFAIQTRRQEQQDQLTEAERRLQLRDRVKEANKSLSSAAKKSGVERFPIFHDAGYKGLYDGMGQAAIKTKKGIRAEDSLLDCIDRAELAANEFRITQTEQKLARDDISSEQLAIRTHHDVGREVRGAIRKIGGTMPEDLPAAAPIRKVIAERKKKARLQSKG